MSAPVERLDDRRDGRRVSLGPGHTIRFRVKGRTLTDVRISNISGTGTFAVVDQGDVHLVEKDSLLDDLVLDHPMLPKGRIRAQVIYLLGNTPQSPPMAFVGIGLHFIEMASETQEALNHFVAAALGEA